MFACLRLRLRQFMSGGVGSSRRRRHVCSRPVEILEDRSLLANLNLLASGNLLYGGGSEVNTLEISYDGSHYTFNDTSGAAVNPIGVAGFTALDTNASDSIVTFSAAAAEALLSGGTLTQIILDGKGGDDVFTLVSLRGGGGEGIDVRDTAGDGDDTINISGNLGAPDNRLGNTVTLRGEHVNVGGDIYTEDFAITVGDKSAVRLGRLFAEVVITSSTSIDAGNATAQINSSSTTGADVDLIVHGAGVQTRGNITLTGASTIRLHATATLLVGDPAVNNTALSSGTGNIELTAATSANVRDSITTDGAVSIDSPSTALGHVAGTITGASVAVSGSLISTSASPLHIDATAGHASVGGPLSSNTAVRVEATGNVSFGGGVSATDIRVTATAVNAFTLQAGSGDVYVWGTATFAGTDAVLVKSTSDIVFSDDIIGNGNDLTLRSPHFIGVGGTITNVATLTTTAATVVIGSSTPPPATPEISVRVGSSNLPDGSQFNLPVVNAGESGSQTIVILNDGTADLILQPVSVSGAAFSISSNFAPDTVVSPGDEVSFDLNFDTSSAGSFTGSLTMENNDGDENPFDLTLAATVRDPSAPAFLIDDGDPGFLLTGNWINVGGYGHAGDAKVITSGHSGTATWTFTGLTAGDYSIATTWLNGGDRWDAVPYVIRDGAGGAVLATVPVNQKVAPNGTIIGGRPFSSLGTVTLTENTLVVEVGNAGSTGAVIADAVQIEASIPVPDSPEISVLSDGHNVLDGSSLNLPVVNTGESGSHTIVIRNDGTADLVLQPVSVTGAAFSIGSNFAPDTVVPAGDQVSFDLIVDTGSAGTFNGTLTTDNNDGNESPFDLTLAATVRDPAAPAFLIDDGDPGFQVAGNWINVAGYGHASDARVITSGHTGTAIWIFSGLTAGDYNISTTWLNGGDRWDAVPYVIRDGAEGAILATVPVNQKVAPVGPVVGGRPFSSLGTVTLTGDTLVVEVSNAGSTGAVIADAVRIEASVPIPDSPEISVTAGASTVLDEGSFSFGSAEQGGPPLSRTFTVRNGGTADLTLEPLTLSGSGFLLTSANFTSGQVLTPNGTVNFTVELSTATTGSFSGEVSFGSNDSDESPFNFNVSGTINAPQPAGVAIIDNGDSGFSSTGNWASVAGYGFGADALAGTGVNGVETARWVFDGLTLGSTQEVTTTWLRGSDREDQVTYVIRDGVGGEVLATVVVDQTRDPTGGITEDRRPFEVLDTVTISGSQLVVELSTLGTTKAVIADAVRIVEQ